jgi:prepilin-type processing-associated H-X9-DG protein
MLLPAISAVRDSARTSACSSSQRQIAMGVMAYCNEWDGLLPFGQIDNACVPVWMGPGTKSWSDPDRVGGYIDGSEALSGGCYPTSTLRRGVWVCAADNRKPGFNYSITAVSYGINRNLCGAITTNAADAETMLRSLTPLSRVRSSASFVLITDTQEARWIANNFPGPTVPPTLAYSRQDLATDFAGTSVQSPYSQFGRHRNAGNGVFVDGHVQLMPTLKDDVLQRRLFVRLADLP